MFLKEFCHSATFIFVSKCNDTDHKHKNKQILNMWGKGESTMTIIHCNYIHTYIKMSSLNFSILRNERTFLPPVHWACDRMVLKGECNTNTYSSLPQTTAVIQNAVTLSPRRYRKSTIFYESADEGEKKEGSWQTHHSPDHGNPGLKLLPFLHVFLHKPGLSYRSRSRWP